MVCCCNPGNETVDKGEAKKEFGKDDGKNDSA
jgi:hypothetical protein